MQEKIISRPDQSGSNSCAAIIVAAGFGVRAASISKFTARQDSPFRHDNFKPDNFGLKNFENDLPKQFWQLGDKPVIAHAFDYFHHHPAIAAIILVVAEPFIPYMADILPETQKPVHLVAGGATRQDSVHAGLTALAGLKNCQNIDYVAIHDAARPLIPADLLDNLIAAIGNNYDDKLKNKIIGAVPVLPLADSIKTIDRNNSDNNPTNSRGLISDGLITGGIDRSQLAAAQTPQLFRRDVITKLHDDFAGKGGFTDDCSLAEAAGFKITMVAGAKQLMKLTDADDFAMLSHLVAVDNAAQEYQQQTDVNSMTETRFGTGFDVHKFSDEAGSIWLGGIKLDSDRRMLAHSDGDVGLHALCDAIFGALADGDIGAHFPASDPQWQNADSTIFLDFATKRVLARGGRILNLDLTFICETPKIGPHRDAIRHRIAEICGISIDRVSVKATTSEGLGFTGRGEGIAAQASASITLPAPSDQNLPDNTAK
ncbi:MAG: 2-C-methyl-D-erythritol 2,4-cyclodiphosphate synthase [Proteobacteria bacterium]|nr:2-C-methyl-D-erythritol 2,4-cyclodiphosphate synthase [Pseudomonadota bacterium]MDA0883765.1 2-C-methyl-D-erythritol 2,4-cyclodiphosphate synthase [Pseudomonadota bacterium]MDA1150822.1 2-C-methyl-D-erythritol 2,4-cyclodiphosphate synthase [Pseudomonadota bacterium]